MIEDLQKKPPEWRCKTWEQRILSASAMLYIHGYISLSKRLEICDKLRNQINEKGE